jgi:hypothetical protein
MYVYFSKKFWKFFDFLAITGQNSIDMQMKYRHCNCYVQNSPLEGFDVIPSSPIPKFRSHRNTTFAKFNMHASANTIIPYATNS